MCLKNIFVGAYFPKIAGTYNQQYGETVRTGITLEKGAIMKQRKLIMSVYSIIMSVFI